MRAIILAGGRGSRLAPYTTVFPKPLMPIGDMPILEILLRQLRSTGIRRATLAVGHLAPLLMAYLGNGERFGIPIEYSFEDRPLGTAGPIAKVSQLETTFLVMNGDLLTDVDFDGMVAFHRQQGVVATIGTCQRNFPIDLGVIETDGSGRVTAYREKPVNRYRASMGVYVFEPSVTRYVPRDEKCDLPDLVNALLEAGEPVAAYLHQGYWLDIGRPDDYQRAVADFPTLRKQLIPDSEAD